MRNVKAIIIVCLNRNFSFFFQTFFRNFGSFYPKQNEENNDFFDAFLTKFIYRYVYKLVDFVGLSSVFFTHITTIPCQKPEVICSIYTRVRKLKPFTIMLQGEARQKGITFLTYVNFDNVQLRATNTTTLFI